MVPVGERSPTGTHCRKDKHVYDRTYINEQDVQRGIDRLNQRGPEGWAGRIDRDTLNIQSNYDCPLGQVYGLYQDGIDALGIANPYDYGFTSNDCHLAIWKRRLAELQPVQVDEPVLVPTAVREPVLAGVA